MNRAKVKKHQYLIRFRDLAGEVQRTVPARWFASVEEIRDYYAFCDIISAAPILETEIEVDEC